MNLRMISRMMPLLKWTIIKFNLNQIIKRVKRQNSRNKRISSTKVSKTSKEPILLNGTKKTGMRLMKTNFKWRNHRRIKELTILNHCQKVFILRLFKILDQANRIKAAMSKLNLPAPEWAKR